MVSVDKLPKPECNCFRGIVSVYPLSPGHFLNGSWRSGKVREVLLASNQTKPGRGSLQHLSSCRLSARSRRANLPALRSHLLLFPLSPKSVRERGVHPCLSRRYYTPHFPLLVDALLMHKSTAWQASFLGSSTILILTFPYIPSNVTGSLPTALISPKITFVAASSAAEVSSYVPRYVPNSGKDKIS